MSRLATRIKRLLNPKSTSTDQLGLCGVVYVCPKPVNPKRMAKIEVVE